MELFYFQLSARVARQPAPWYAQGVKFLARWLFRLLVLALALAVALLLLRDHLLEEYLEAHGQRLTGLEVRIGRVESGLLRPELHLEDVRVYDPPEFGGGPFLTAREVHLEYDPAALARGSLRLRLLRAHARWARPVPPLCRLRRNWRMRLCPVWRFFSPPWREGRPA